MTDNQVWNFIELVARGNTEMVELERLASELIEEKYEIEQSPLVDELKGENQ